jgi:hypothetical protein
VSVIAFNTPSAECAEVLVVVLANNMFLVYDLDSVSLSEWSTLHTASLPRLLHNLPGPLEGVSFQGSMRFFLYGQSYLVFVDLDQAIPTEAKIVKSVSSMAARGGRKQLMASDAKNARLSAKKKKKRESLKGGVTDSSSGEKSEISNSNFTTIELYRSIIHVGAVSENQLVSSSG